VTVLFSYIKRRDFMSVVLLFFLVLFLGLAALVNGAFGLERVATTRRVAVDVYGNVVYRISVKGKEKTAALFRAARSFLRFLKLSFIFTLLFLPATVASLAFRRSKRFVWDLVVPVYVIGEVLLNPFFRFVTRRQGAIGGGATKGGSGNTNKSMQLAPEKLYVGLTVAFYQRLGDGIYRLIGKAPDKIVAYLFYEWQTCFIKDGDTALDKSSSNPPEVIKEKMDQLMGKNGRILIDDEDLKKQLAVLRGKQATRLVKLAISVAIATLKYKPLPGMKWFHLGRYEYEKDLDGLMEIANSSKVAYNGNLKEFVHQTIGKVERVESTYTPYAAFAIVEEEKNQDDDVDYVNFDDKVIIPLDCMRAYAVVYKSESYLLSNYRVPMDSKFEYQRGRYIPVAARAITLKQLQKIESFVGETGEKPQTVLDFLNAKGEMLDLVQRSSANRPGSKWFRTSKSEFYVFGPKEFQQVSLDSILMSPLGQIGAAKRFTGSTYTSRGLDVENPFGKKCLIKFTVKGKATVLTETEMNIRLTAFVPKNFHYFSVMGETAFIGDEMYVLNKVDIVSEKGEPFKIIASQKNKAMSVFGDTRRKVEIEWNGKRFRVDILAPIQEKRGTNPCVIGESALRFLNDQDKNVPIFEATNVAEMEQVSANAMEQVEAKLYIDGKLVCSDCYVGLMKFAVDRSQDYTVKVRKLGLGYTQAMLTMVANKFTGRGVTTEDFSKLAITKKAAAISCMARDNYKVIKSMPKPVIVDTNMTEDMASGYDDSERAMFVRKLNKSLQSFSGTFRTYQDRLLYAGYCGTDIAKIIGMLYDAGQYHEVSAAVKAKEINDMCATGIKVTLPWSEDTFEFRLVTPTLVQRSRESFEYGDGEVEFVEMEKVIAATELRELLNLCKISVGYSLVHDIDIKSWYKAVHQLKKLYVRQFCNNAVHYKGLGIAGRCCVQHQDGDGRTTVPTKALLEAFGFRYDRKRFREFDSESVRMMRAQAPEMYQKINFIVQIFDIAEDAWRPWQLDKILNEEIKEMKCGLVRHPVIGCLPYTSIKVSWTSNMICIPANLAARYTGLNADADGDIAYVYPIQ
jgi:hypothetical protein